MSHRDKQCYGISGRRGTPCAQRTIRPSSGEDSGGKSKRQAGSTIIVTTISEQRVVKKALQLQLRILEGRRGRVGQHVGQTREGKEQRQGCHKVLELERASESSQVNLYLCRIPTGSWTERRFM